MESFRKIVGQLKLQKQTSSFEIFLQAVKDGNLKEAKNSFRGDFLEMTSDDYKRPIHFACENGHVEIAKLLLENKCNTKCEAIWKKRPIHFACENGHVEIAKLLLENKTSIECENYWKKRPIHYACMAGHLEIVKLLLNNNASIECEDNRNWRPIHVACYDGHVEIVKLFLENKCNIECEDKDKQRPIHLASEEGNVEVVKLLLKNKCNIECEDKDKQRPIYLASEKGNVEIVKLLLENKCRIEFEDKDKKRPIHFACYNGHVEIVKLLLENNCSIEFEDKDNWRPIHYACMAGHLKIVKLLLKYNASIECEDNWKWRPIHVASEKGNLEIVKLLVLFNCQIDCKTIKGETPMEIVKKNGHKNCEKFLNESLQRHKKIFDCVRNNDAQTLIALCSPDILTMQENGFSLLEVALKSNADKIIDYFFNKPVTAEEITILENYMKSVSRPDAVQLVQECLLYRSIRFHDADGFHLCCSAKTINEYGKLSSFLQVAAEYGCKPFIQSLLKKSIYNEEEWTKAEGLAILKGHIEIAEAISKRKILLKKTADKEFTWLHSAVCDNDPDMVKYILEKHLVNPDSNNEVVGTGLALAHMMCYEDCIEVLENFNVNVNTQNKYSQSPLHEAIASGMTDHCSYLISRVQDIDKPGFMGFTGLQCAVIKGCEDLCNQLVKNGADCVRYIEILQQSSIKRTAVLPISQRENAVTLCMKINQTIYPCFLGVLNVDKMKCGDGEGNSLLHIAVKTVQPDLCNTLIKSGANVEALNDQGNSPLLELLCNHDNRTLNDVIEKLNILIESGADVNKVSNSGINVFQVASQWNSERLMLSLLSKQPKVKFLTATDFKLAFMQHWFEYATILITLMSENLLQSFITTEIFQFAMVHSAPKLLMSLFLMSSHKVQQSVIEELLDHFASIDRYDYFVNLVNTGIMKPKLLSSGETLLTSLLKKKNLRYCWATINFETNKKCVQLPNVMNQTPLEIAIESELFDLINVLIFICGDQSNVEFNWDAPLISLFQKLSLSTNDDVDQKLLVAIKAIISRGGNIFKETCKGSPLINYCYRFRETIESFQNNERRNERDDKNICSICLDREINCVFDCGHTFCMDCGTQLYRCAICNSTQTNPKNLYIT